MILRIDHVAIAVKDYEKAYDFFTGILGAVPGAGAGDDNLKFNWQLFSLGDLSRLELLRPYDKGSYLENFLKNRDGGVHHITMQTDDINRAKEILEERGIPYFGYNCIGDIWKELFIHPRDAFGVLIQIAQLNPNDWISESQRLPQGEKFDLENENGDFVLTVASEGGGKSQARLNIKEARRLKDKLEELLEFPSPA